LHLQQKNKVVELERDTFRDDVRAEWIRAVFGADFPKQNEIERTDARTSNPSQTKTKNHKSWKGVGLAGISSYVTYTADLDLSQYSTSSSSLTTRSAVMNGLCHTGSGGANGAINTLTPSKRNQNHKIHDEKKDESLIREPPLTSELQPQQQLQPSLGMTLSRLSLGLYVRTVRPGSEAWCAGVEENSVLVGINDGELNLLAEPSKLALERMWQYEGFSCISTNNASATNKDLENTSNSASDTHVHTVSTNYPNSKMKIHAPISLTFIRNGNIYKVLLLSDPPYGIDWGPCGKFCLIQHVKSEGIADRAGVRASSIVAGINLDEIRKNHDDEDGPEDENNYNDKNNIYRLDHSSVATALKEATSSCIRQQHSQNKHAENIIRIQLCFTPSEARSGHWERQQDALEDKRSNKATSGGRANTIKRNNNTLMRNQQQPNRPRVAAELDGVQVRIHPLLGRGGSITGTSRSGSGSASKRARSPNNNPCRRRSTSGCVVSPSSLISKLAERVAAGEPLSIWGSDNRQYHHKRNNNEASSSSGAEYGNFYRPCPMLKNVAKANTNMQPSSNLQPSSPSLTSTPSIFDCWDVQQAFIYIFRHHLAGYNEENTRIRASENIDFLNILRNLSQKSQTSSNTNSDVEESIILDALSTLLLFWLGWLTARENKPLELTQFLLKLVHQNQIKNNLGSRTFPNRVDRSNVTLASSSSLAHHMEFLAGSLENVDIKLSLRSMRKERQHHQHLLQNISQPGVGNNAKGSNILPPVGAVTGTTPTHQQSLQSKELKFDRVNEQRAASVPIKVECPLPDKPKSRRLLHFFRRKKRHANKKELPSSNFTATSTIAHMTSHEGTNGSQENRRFSFDGKTVATREDKLSASKGFVSKTSEPPDSKSSSMILKELSNVALSQSMDSLFANTVNFLEELETVCLDIEKSLMRSFSQKFARWALQPWTANKESALAEVTNAMRKRLERCNQEGYPMPLLDPIDSSSQPLLSIDTNGCYILPSAHFPLLLTFDCKRRGKKDLSIKGRSRDTGGITNFKPSSRTTTPHLFGEEQIYRTSVEFVALKGAKAVAGNEKSRSRGFTVHGSVAGCVIESQQSVRVHRESNRHIWDRTNIMVFDSRSTWGPPKTLSLRLPEALIDPTKKDAKTSADATPDCNLRQQECGYCWIDLTPYWEQTSDKRESWYDRKTTTKPSSGQVSCKAQVVPPDFFKDFDEHGDVPKYHFSENVASMEIELRITTRILETKSCIKRSLLYKHDDDVRQEMFAIEFIKSCDRILQSCGLHMKMLTFCAIPVSKRRGFIEWVQGSVPLSEICQPFAGSILAKNGDKNKKMRLFSIENNEIEDIGDEGGYDNDNDDSITLSSVAKAGMTKYESLNRLRTEDESSEELNPGGSYVLPNNNNPIQDFLRSLAYDPDGSYKIKRDVMDTFVKSCAGYSVCTYILGVGDRHLDNLLLHESGHFFHCDYSFILGQDPKKYLPMRITTEMINGMGGWKSDNFCQFLSLACAAFLTLRRPENVRHLLSLIRLLKGCGLPDLEKTQSIEDAIQGVRDRLKLDLTDEEVIVFMEKLIEDSCASKMWIAVDAMHSLAQKF